LATENTEKTLLKTLPRPGPYDPSAWGSGCDRAETALAESGFSVVALRGNIYQQAVAGLGPKKKENGPRLAARLDRKPPCYPAGAELKKVLAVLEQATAWRRRGRLRIGGKRPEAGF
jgi:hypothetical protein